MEPFPYRLERLTDARLPDVQRLLAEVLHKRVALEWVRHKYDTRYTGVGHVSCLAYDGDRPVGFYGVVPQVFSTPAGARFVGCHIADNMTLPSHQRQGIFKATAQATFGFMRDAGVHVVYGFSSVATLVPHERLGFTHGGTLRGYVVEAARLPMARAFRKLPLLRGWQQARVHRTLAQWALAPEAFSNSHRQEGIAAEYSPAFFASKQFHPQYLVELEGVKFWLCVDAVVRVGDVHFEDAAHLLWAVAKLKRLASLLGIQQLVFQTFAGSRLDLALETEYRGFESWPIVYKELLPGFDFGNYKPNYADQDSF